MKERPILMQTSMAEATLAGRKTQTRRMTGLDIINKNPDRWVAASTYVNAKGEFIQVFNHKDHIDSIVDFKYPYGKPGDVLWVRESFFIDHNPIDKTCKHDTVTYKAGLLHRDVRRKGVAYSEADIKEMCQEGWHDSDYPDGAIKWKPSIHMPKAAARIWLQVTDIRVERLQSISDKDAISEGIMEIEPDEAYKFDIDDAGSCLSANSAFRSLIQSIHGPEIWKHNPWVWVVQFEVLSTNGKPHSINNPITATI